MEKKPEILAPAGDMPSALAALAAGADAIYLGLKHFSARMQADNFSGADLARIVDLAHAEGRKVYLTLNTFIKPGETTQVSRLLKRVLLGPAPDALIIQDLALVDLARQVGFKGEFFFSTLAVVTHQRALYAARELGASRVVLPRELSIDEIRLLEADLPAGLGLELFVHGALCYNVSGRCWWSSYLGGKSGLRGRCTQPCRRIYTQGSREGRFFSCRDFSLDVLVKTVLELPGVCSWKIEGRKKGPHYVFHTVSGYRILRDNPEEAGARKEALSLLEFSLGRPSSRGWFLPQRAVTPTPFGEAREGRKLEAETGSGLVCGKIVQDQAGNLVLKTRMELLPKDYLRIGYEDEPWHHMLPLNRRLPKNGSLTLKLPQHKRPRSGTPVFLVDRQEEGLSGLIREWSDRLAARRPQVKTDPGLMDFEPVLPKAGIQARRLDILLSASLPRGKEGKTGIHPGTVRGLWLSIKAMEGFSHTLFDRVSWWLPPVIWPEEEDHWARLVRQALRGGARHFVCNAPWQTALFDQNKGLSLSAGPFCNISNGFAIGMLKDMGFSLALVSPELGEEDYLVLPKQSPLPLGIVVGGFWPMGITRYETVPLKPETHWSSPKREMFWSRRYGRNTWLYSAWPLDLRAKIPLLEKAGYSVFVQMGENPPQHMEKSDRGSVFNWEIGAL